MRKGKIIIILVILALLGFGAYSYLYQGHRDIASEKQSYLVTANSIFEEFKTNETKANDKYLNKAIEA